MSLLRITVLAAATVGASTALLLACVGDDATPVVTATTTPDAGSSGTPTPTPTTDDGGLTTGTPDSGTDASTASDQCTTYCSSFSTKCGFSTTVTNTDSYPDNATCLAVCALMPTTTGTTDDNLLCRRAFLAPSSPDCPAAGPWGFDADTQSVCGGGQPCSAICRIVTSSCATTTTANSDCLSFCSNLEVDFGTAKDECMEQRAFKIATTAPSSSALPGAVNSGSATPRRPTKAH